jgi:hypothetical protein
MSASCPLPVTHVAVAISVASSSVEMPRTDDRGAEASNTQSGPP